MRVYEINTVARRDNAPGRIMLDIADAVVKAGGDVRIASRDMGITSGVHKLIHAIGSRLSDKEGLMSRRSTMRLCDDISEWNADIVHLHNIHGHYINYPYLFEFLREYGRPVVWTLHDCWAFTGHCAYYHARGCSKWQKGCGDCSATGEYPVSYGHDKSANNYELKRKLIGGMPNLKIVGVSDWLASQVRQSFLGGNKIMTIANGVDTEIFKPRAKSSLTDRADEGKNGKYRIIAVASNWKRNKGLHIIKSLEKRLPKDMELKIISGIANQEKLAKVYSGADLLINPSQEEAFGMIPVEAMACGTPVIVNDNTAQRETVTAETGLVVNFSDTNVLIEAIERMREAGKAAYSDSCRRHVMTNYSLSRMTDSYIGLFNGLM